MASKYSPGPGSRLPIIVLLSAGVSTAIAVLVSGMSIYLQLKSYRKPHLQRMVIRIMIMVPIYGISSLISLFSVEAAFVIDAIRDIYEAFVIYCFFVLLLSYLGGERSLLTLLHGRPPKEPPFPVSLFKREIDVSDPYTFLFLKRGILQYVQVKPILAAATLVLKALGKFNEGDFRANSGYLYVSVIYNTSICLSLYCLAMFWLCVNDDLKSFRPVPKFLCVKGILFFSFWQSIVISILVAANVITKLGPYTDPENIAVGLTDTLICLEMPFFAIAHLFAFSYTDYIDEHCSYVARMPMYYAFRDAFGILDVIEDSKATLRGEGMDYREFEPAEGLMHQGIGRDRRIRAGLRYSKGGQRKYWLPRPTADTQPPGSVERGINRIITKVVRRDQGEGVHAPLLASECEDLVHIAPDMREPDQAPDLWDNIQLEGGYELPFGDLDEGDEELFAHSRKYLFGDYNYPCIDVSSENARVVMWDEEERVLRDERGAWFSPIRGAKGQTALEQRQGPAWQGYGAVDSTQPTKLRSGSGSLFHDNAHDAPGIDIRIINHEQGQVPIPEPRVIKKKWANTRGQGSQAASQSQSPHLQNRLGLQADTSSVALSWGSNGVRSPPSMSRHNSRTAGSPLLPLDAVDLVVEDSQAAQEEQLRERRKGEPAVRGPGLRKVYRREFVGHGEEGESDPPIRERVDAREEIMETLEAGSAGPNRSRSEELYHSEEAEGIVARTETPPLHARILAHNYDISDEHNPWA